MKFYIVVWIHIGMVTLAASQNTDTSKVKNFRILPIPVLSVAPETGFMYGAGAATTFRLHPGDMKERPSSVNAGLAFTTEKQFLSFAQFSIFERNKRFYFGELGYYNFSYFFYGVGREEVKEELYRVKFPRIKINVIQKINPHFGLGLGINYERFNITETVKNGALAQGIIEGSDLSTSSGIGLLGMYDTRDNVFFPGKGVFANLNFFVFGKNLGGSHQFCKITSDIALYKSLFHKTILASQIFHSFAIGRQIPFQQLPQIGGPKAMRGYYQGRYTDKNLSMWQTELRIPLYWRFGLAVFGGGALLGDEHTFLRTDDIKFSYGLGLRFTFNTKENLNLRFDYARGSEKGFIYLTVGEAF